MSVSNVTNFFVSKVFFFLSDKLICRRNTSDRDKSEDIIIGVLQGCNILDIPVEQSAYVAEGVVYAAAGHLDWCTRRGIKLPQTKVPPGNFELFAISSARWC